MEFKETGQNNLQNAINKMPEFAAPNIWKNISNKLPSKNNNWYLLLIIAIITTLLLLHFLNSPNKGKALLPNKSKTLVSTKNHIDNNIQETTIAFSKLNQNTTIIEPINNIEISNIEHSNIDISIDTNFNDSELLIIADTQMVYNDIGENLVPNASFEEFNLCPKDFNHRSSKKLIPKWRMASKGTPDYFNKCAESIVDIPENFAGTAYPHSGNAYVGIIMRQNFTRDNRITGEKPSEYREYIQAMLNTPLEKDKEYRVKFYVRLSSRSRFSGDAMGAYLSMDKFFQRNKEVIEYIPQVDCMHGKTLNNKDTWVAIEGIFTAKGGEKYITIGNFRHNFNTMYRMSDHESSFNYAYYYIDDISVVEVEAEHLIVYRYIDNNFILSAEKQLSDNSKIMIEF